MIIATTLAAVAAMVLPGAPAPAADGTDVNLGSAGNLTYIRDTITMPASGDPVAVTETAKCPSGMRAVSGGATIRNTGARGIATLTPFYNGAEDPVPVAWGAEAWQSSPVASPVNVYAVCSSSKFLSYNRSFKSAPIGPSDVNDQTSCENGHVIGGGVVVLEGAEGTPDWTLNSTYPIDDTSDADTATDDGWSVYTQYSDTTETGSMLVDAICRGGAQPIYKTKTVDVAPGAAAVVAARCPKGTRAVGGGAFIGGASSSSHVVVTRPYDSADTGKVPEDGWQAGFRSTTDIPLVGRVHAICI